MDVLSALNVGITGVLGQSASISTISQNISNADTVGYKAGMTTFAELITDSSANNYSASGSGSPNDGYAASGVKPTDMQLVDVQGSINAGNSPTDLAISGPGFFTVSPTATASADSLEFTRAGSFTPNADGNYVNAAGQFLQAWPISLQGTLPDGITGPTVDSGTGISALQPVNIQNLIEIPVPTTNVSIAANLNSSEATYPLGNGTVTMDKFDTNNYGITADTVIVPSSVDHIAEGDTMNVSTADNPAGYTYTYGGIAYSRSINDPAILGSSGATVPSPVTLAAADAVTFDPAAPTAMTISLGATTPTQAGMQAGTVISLAGTTGNGLNVNNITSLDGDYYVTAVDNTNNTVTVAIPSNITPPSAMSLTGATFTASNGSDVVHVTGATIPSGMENGDTVTFSGIPGIDAVMTGAVLNAPAGYVVSNVNAVAGTFDITTTTTDTTAGGSVTAMPADNAGMFDQDGNLSAATASVSSNLFSGNIMDASAANAALINTPADFTPAALSFTITTPSTGTSTFTYTSSITPNAALGQFNSLDSLANAISDVSGLSARVVNDQLYVSSIDGNDSIRFANGSAAGTNSSPPLAGIDWVNDLGLANVAAAPAGTERFSTLQGLNDLVNNSSGLTATVTDPTGNATVNINVNNELDTLQFADGGGNSGSLVSALGLSASLQGGAFTPQTAGPFGYDPAVSNANMASGAVAPDFSIPVTVVDSKGNNHTLTVGFIKTANNSWAVEAYVQPSSDTTAANGQVAVGTVTFNNDGSLASISPSLTQMSVGWTDGAAASSIAFDWGTAGPVGTAEGSGLTQFAENSDITNLQQNGLQANTSTSVAVSSTGVISVTYSSGGTRDLYQIPLAEFRNPDGLQANSGNFYTQTAAAGALSFLEPGAGNGAAIDPDSLEASNVNLTTQLTDLIAAQNAYQANTQLISASDQMLQTANQMVGQSVSV